MTSPTVDDGPRPGPTFRQRRIDLGIALAIATVAILNVFLSRSVGLFASGASPSVIEQLGWSLAVTLPLIWRRSHPDVVAVVRSAARRSSSWPPAPSSSRSTPWAPGAATGAGVAGCGWRSSVPCSAG
jgi:hypothetical protein